MIEHARPPSSWPQQYAPSERCIILYHVAKSGGTSLHDWFASNGLKLWSHYGTGNLTNQLHLRGDRGNRMRLEDAHVIMGHLRPRVANTSFLQMLRAANFRKDCAQWTVLREPYSRVVSLLWFQYPRHANRNMSAQEALWADCVDAEERLTSPGPCIHSIGLGSRRQVRNPQLRNGMCSQFSNVAAHVQMYNDIREPGWQEEYCSLASAKSTLASLNIGFLEDINTTLEAWSNYFQLSPTKRLQRLNPTDPSITTRSHSRPKLPALDAIIRSHNQADALLYQWVKDHQRQRG
jgi:hypothetical protein